MRSCIENEARRLLRDCRKLKGQAENLVFECWGAEDHGEIGAGLCSHAEEAQDYLDEACQALEGVLRAL